MTPVFDLIYEPWIPCIAREGQSQLRLGIRDALANAHQIREVTHSSPLATVAVHRLLLAILHRVFGPEDEQAWSRLWSEGRFDASALNAYLDGPLCRGCFNLFDADRPFFQVASLDAEYAAPVSTLVHSSASGNNATLFDHSIDADPPALPPSEAALTLLAYHSYAVGGLISFEKGQDRRLFGVAKAAPLVKGAVAIVRGDSLFETLMLNLHQYAPARDMPFPATANDRPVWERDTPTQVEERRSYGYLDYLTWQSRRVRLVPEIDPQGKVAVRRAVGMKGEEFPLTFHVRQAETMVAFRTNPKATAQSDPYPAVGFQPERALWRDSLVLFEVTGADHARPRTFDWLGDLIQGGMLRREQTLRVDFLGMTADRAKVLLWRHERLPLPLPYLDDKDLRAALRDALQLAEHVGTVLRRSVWHLATLLLAPTADETGGRQPRREQIDPIYRNLAPEREYWWQLEAPFRILLEALPGEIESEDAGAEQHLAHSARRRWQQAVRSAARAAFEETAGALDSTGRALKAVASSERSFAAGLAAALEAYLPISAEEAA